MMSGNKTRGNTSADAATDKPCNNLQGLIKSSDQGQVGGLSVPHLFPAALSVEEETITYSLNQPH